MATTAIPTAQSVTQADTNANGNTLVMRDAAGGDKANIRTATSLVTTGTLVLAPSNQTAAFTIGDAVDYYCDATVAAFAVTMLSAATYPGRTYSFTKTDAVAHTVTLTGVLGVSTVTTQYQRVTIKSDGANWYGA